MFKHKEREIKNGLINYDQYYSFIFFAKLNIKILLPKKKTKFRAKQLKFNTELVFYF